MNVVERPRNTDEGREYTGDRGQTEQHALQFIAVGTATNDMERGEPDKVSEQHHPGDQRQSHAEKYFSKSHGSIVMQ